MNPFASADRRNLFSKASDEAYAQYFDLLQRIDAPADNDLELLADLLPFLGINMSQAAKDFEILKRARELEALITKGEEAERLKQQLEPKYKELSEEWATVKTQWEPRLNEMSCRIAELGKTAYDQYEARARLAELKQKFPRAFGQKPVPKTTTSTQIVL